MHIFTSVTSNYIPKARVLACSLKKYHPEADFTLILSDTIPPWLEKKEPFDRIITIEKLKIPDFKSWVFKHSLVEMCTAVKGYACQYLIDELKAKKIFYFDPDIVIFSSLDALNTSLENNSILLTPHQSEPEKTEQAIIDNEICSLKHGVFNLGFLGLRADKNGKSFVNWWKERLRLFCYDNIPEGIFTDQRWIDLAPCFFSNIKILRNPEYNVCTWNITTRNVAGNLKNGITVNGKPLCFYHFSGFDSGAQEVMLNVYGNNNKTLKILRNWYIDECNKKGQKLYGNNSCFFNFFENGEPITKEHRQLYRQRKDLQNFFPDPFITKDINNSYYHWFLKNNLQEKKENNIDIKNKLEKLIYEINEIKNSRSWKLAIFFRKLYRSIFLFK